MVELGAPQGNLRIRDASVLLGEQSGQYAYTQKELTLGELHIVSSGFSTGTESTRWVLGHAEIS